ncbi:PREDICTED: uncharacterized protein LOC109329308 [Lupinus angustifolius]|uniref:uncharacterized protein LOC109329308 n=1 Tax=Lupinus angustifolius TaxID=3871 RepID=UPI00092FBCD9|nr:PREDICTED: uncharacterized protein LOC109329308 [Lupinus angustifolius]
MADLGELPYFLGIEFKKTRLGTFMHQTKYTIDVIKRFQMLECNIASTPTETNTLCNQTEEEKQVDKTLFRQIIGSLRYICNTRPYIAYGVGLTSTFMEKSSTISSHCSKESIEIGVVINLIERVPQACMCACQAAWMKALLEELRMKTENGILLMVDNKSAINLALNPVAHGRSKHIETRFHYFRDQVSKGKIRLEFCNSEKQQADVLTKPLKRERFGKLRLQIGVKESE